MITTQGTKTGETIETSCFMSKRDYTEIKLWKINR